MKIRALSQAAATLAWLGLLIPQGALAEAPVETFRCGDVALQEGGLLIGQVVNAQGRPFAETTVSIHHGEREIARADTDADGRFAAKGLRGGLHHLVVGGNQIATYRLWAPETAPPAANSSVLVVSSDEILNGQCGCDVGCGDVVSGSGCCGGCGSCGGCPSSPLGMFIKRNPLLVTAGVAAAIAIPIAVANNDDDPAS